MAEKSDGAIMGSPIIKLIAQHRRDSVDHVRGFVKKFANVVHAGAN